MPHQLLADWLQEDGHSRPVAEVNKIAPQLKRGDAIPNHLDAYSLHTLPGVDSVFMLAATVALDESILSPSQGSYGQYGCGTRGYGGMGYGGMGYGGMGYGGLGGMGFGGMGYGAPLMLGAGLGLGGGMLMGGMW